MRQLRRHTRAKLGQHLVFHSPTDGGPTEPRLDATQQGFEAHRFHQKIVRPFLHALAGCHQIGPPGHQHNLPGLKFRIAPDVPKECRAISSGHMDVAEDQIGQMLPSHIEASSTGISLDDPITAGAQCSAECDPQVFRVIDQ